MTVETAPDWPALNEVAQKVGKRVAGRWPGIDADDCAQEALLSILEHPQIVEGEDSLIEAAMTKVANTYASNERYEFMMRTAQYVYTPREVRRLLDGYYVQDAHTVPNGDDDFYKPQTDASTGFLDIEAAMKDMPPEDAWRLKRRFQDGEDYPTKAAAKATDRAVDRLCRLMNYRMNSGN